MTEITVSQNAARHRFELLDGGKVIGKAAYQEYTGGSSPQRIFYHTVVNEEYGGQGLGLTLASEALNATVADGLEIVPVCPFIKKYVGRHHEYDASVVAVTPEHLQFLESALHRD
ncbi:GNAT family N-acetyltransferase [Pseudarthrobacter sp. J75]|uniref:GNAT family N-acetyltransferase n=1 Tax=unclassified Pseudarthrobacter TaxID=2647000 RepID=UPI002E807D86|nr:MULTISPECIES: GNAT family N-acetyltransferase [unclassified Pseudarthrobacter]MEE2527540.1 GNAT family N-acetyltransferase [Pseudarthrobacter sp. J75]MEE2569763.1 GNAT family N-acetyltransferase [Pseudarthrobacter sp. J64]